jgi:hypothetical protein
MTIMVGASFLHPGHVWAGDGGDGIISRIWDTQSYGHTDPSGTGDFISAFSFGFTWCNVGTEPLSICSFCDQPGMHQSLYRLRAGQFEQIGMSWVWRDVFYALNQSFCGLECEAPPDPSPRLVYPGCGEWEPASITGGLQMSPTSDIDAYAGTFPIFPSITAGPGIIARRLQVHDADLEPSQNTGATYFVQVQQIHPDDAAAGNAANNASYHRVNVSFDTVRDRYVIALAGATQVGQSAIRAWRNHDSTVRETEVAVPGEGNFVVAAKATDLGTGFWHYEYAVQNLNSDRSGGSFTVPLPIWATVENVGFHDVDYHTGEPWDSADWTAERHRRSIRWATTPYDENPNANALRWSTLYNFRFEADAPPAETTVTMGLFKPGTPEGVRVRTIGPLRLRLPIDSTVRGK